MKTISFPILPGDSGTAVKALHNAMVALSAKIEAGPFLDLFANEGIQQLFMAEMSESVFGSTTEKIILVFQQHFDLREKSGAVDEYTAAAINLLMQQHGFSGDDDPDGGKYKVSGHVRDQWQQPLIDVVVTAFDKDIRSEQMLGEVRTNKRGFYEVRYSREQFARTDKKAADVFLTVTGADGKLIKKTSIYYNSPVDLVLDISVGDQPYKGVSEYEHVLAAVLPFTGELPLSALAENTETKDITFLTNKTGLQQTQITSLATAFSFEALTKIEAPVFYGLLREGVPAGETQQLLKNIAAQTLKLEEQQLLDGIMHTGIDTLMHALQQAIAGNLVPFQISARLKQIKKQLEEAIQLYAQQHPGTGSSSPLFQQMQIAGLSPDESRKVIGLLGQYQGDLAPFLSDLKAGSAFSGVADQLGTVFQLHSLTDGNLALTSHLVKKQKITTAADIAGLAGNTAADWKAVLKSAGQPQKNAEKLVKNFTKKFPTAAFSARLKKDKASKIPGSAELSGFFNQHPGFDLQHDRVEAFLATHAAKAKTADKAVLGHSLRRLQRVFKLARSYEATHALMEKGIHSAQQVNAMGKEQFTKSFSPALGKKEAQQIFSNAAKMSAATIAAAGTIHSMATASAIKVLPDFQTAMLATAAAKEIPNLDILFQHADFCECDECASVYGAAAYLTDILDFLGQRHTDSGGGPVRDVLLARRPDIGDIDLDCDNTNTVLPYIDIVNEILEETIQPTSFMIARSFDASLPAFTPLVKTAPLPDKQYPIQPALLAELITHTNVIPHINLLLTGSAMVSDAFQVTGSTLVQWIIRDKYLVLKLSEDASTITVQLLHQTLLSADELSANPEYTNVKVYTDFLKTAVKPFTLPFDLFSTEGNLYLTKLGIAKADLVRIFAPEQHPAAAVPAPAELDEAYAYLGVSFEERDLIFKNDTPHQANYWGSLAGSATVEVDLFLQYTGLEYADLLTLLTLQFINPAGDSKIDHDDLSCDLDKQHITAMTDLKFDHMHRFLRLWKKTSLTLQELDACIQCPALHTDGVNAPVIDIDPLFAWQFHQFLQVKDRLALDVFPMLALYQDIQNSGDDNLYNDLFQNKQVTYPLNADFALANVNAGIPITDIHKSVIQAATFISPADLDTLLAGNAISTLSLGNLSIIYRNGLLLQAQSFSAADLGIAKQVIPFDFFASPAGSIAFLAAFDVLSNAGFSVWEINYLLRQQNDLNQTLIPADTTVLANLGELQNALLLIGTNTSVQPDPSGALLAKWLGDPLLNWDPVVAAKLLNILKTIDDLAYTGQVVPSAYLFLENLRVQYDQPFHQVTLSAMAPLENLSLLSANITYDPVAQQLKFTGAMTANEQTALLAAFADQDYQDAVSALFAASQLNPASAVPLAALPALTAYAQSSGQLLFNPDTKTLRFAGYMDTGLRDTLKGFYTAPNSVQDALDQLFAAQLTDSSPSNIFFTTNAAVDTDLKSLNYANIAARFDFFLQKISPVYQAMQQRTAIQNRIGSWFTVDKTVAAQLLSSVPAIYTDWTAAAFIAKASSLTSANYPAQYNWYLWLAKTGLLVTRLKMDAASLAWILLHPAQVAITDLSSLPLSPGAAPVSSIDFSAFQNLINLLSLHHSYTPGTTGTIFGFFDDVNAGAATADNLETTLSGLYAWDKDQLKALIETPGYLNLLLSPPASSDLDNIGVLLRLYKCFSVMALLGTNATDCFNWSKASLSADDASKIKQTLKSAYSDADWLGVTQPLQNKLREQKRDALVTYLLDNPGPNTWLDADDLYSFFLVDVEMSAGQTTSRIVQATNSVQEFVQRCFMSLENDITVNASDETDVTSYDSKWSQWEWMKYYRLWEANRKVFLYPENWIEPELLPQPSPFFSELQNQLLQNEVTRQNAEDAFMAYLVKLDDVARLEVKGMWYEDDSQTLHVVARTYGGDPKICYYRQYVENRRWTAWEKIDLDINSDHIIPIVFNQRLYIFWAVFTEKAREVADTMQVPTQGTPYTIQKPQKYWQVQMAFSEYRNGKWSPKKISNNDLTGIIEVDQVYDPSSQTYSPDKSAFLFVPVDLPAPDYSNLAAMLKQKDVKGWLETLLGDFEASLKQNGTLNLNSYLAGDYYEYLGTFNLDPCRGYPVVTDTGVQIDPKLFSRSGLQNMLDSEDPDQNANDYLGFPGQLPLLAQTPGLFRNLLPMQAGFFDRLLFMMRQLLTIGRADAEIAMRRATITLGTYLPFFHQDMSYGREKSGRTYYVAPELTDNDNFELFYSDLEAWFLEIIELVKAALEGDAATVAKIAAEFPQFPAHKQIRKLYHFYNFYHPMCCYFMRQLFSKGVDGLMSRQTQLKGDIAYDSNPAKFSFKDTYAPQKNVYTGQPVSYPTTPVFTDQAPGYPREDVDFNIQSGYSLYNWELFYHIPLMIGEQLSENQQFEDADKWFRYIFNPADASAYPAPDKFWITKPFFLNVKDTSGNTKYDLQRIEHIMFGIADPSAAHPNDLDKNVEDWRENPFQPHYIAQYRTVAYQKTTVMKYLDHLIRWGDYLFTQDTMESVTEATQIYVLAGQILGKEPAIIPPAYVPLLNNYYQLQQKTDSFSNVLVEIENLMPMQTYQGFDFSDPGNPDLPAINGLYFCIPFNDNLLQYWKTISQRLFNIRHCLNIDGEYAPLALFAPPIDPGLLVRATAAGLDLSSILNDLNAPLPLYRFSIMIQKAIELCGQVQSLGGALLSALEKKDAEHLALLRSGQEISLLTAVLQLKTKQIAETQNQIDNLTKQKELTTIKRDFYQNLISSGLKGGETAALVLNGASIAIDAGIAIGYTLAGGLKLIPDFLIGAAGFGGSPTATAETGGKSFGDSADDLVKTLQSIAAAFDKAASLSNTVASYERRSDEWQNQLNMANKELEQLDVQLLGAQIRLDIANTDKDNQQLQIDNAKESDDFMHSKFTNEDLYSWMISKISGTYFQTYQLAFAAAKKAEQCYRYELGLTDSAYVKFGYWDSMKQGLQSGESLMYNLKQLEMAYYDGNKREYELTKSISLSQLDPVALLQLKETGACFLNLPEELFDLDYPGHYFRRLKSVSLSIPCVAGPYTTIGCTLTLMNNSIRIDGTSVSDAKKYPRKSLNNIPADDPRFRDSGGTSQSIVLSHGQTDSGLFELNFRDERYLPFEGAGSISKWHLQFPFANTLNKAGTGPNTLLQQFNYDTISDVIVQLKYTAREGGDALKANASDSLLVKINAMLVSLKETGLMRMFSLKRDFPTEWYAFLNQPDPLSQDQTLAITIDSGRLPYFVTQANLKISRLSLYADASVNVPKLQVTSAGNVVNTGFTFAANPAFGTLQVSSPVAQPWGNTTLGAWKIVNPGTNGVLLSSTDLSDIYLLAQLTIG